VKKLFGFVFIALVLTGCSTIPEAPRAKDSLDKACTAWKLADGERDYDTALKNFAEAASIDSGYIEVSKSAQILEMIFRRLIDSDMTTDELTNHLLNVNAVCGISRR
jgi:hypothetical protein